MRDRDTLIDRSSCMEYIPVKMSLSVRYNFRGDSDGNVPKVNFDIDLLEGAMC